MQLKTLTDISEQFSISTDTIRFYINNYNLPHHRLRRKILIDPEELAEWFRLRREKAGEIPQWNIDNAINNAITNKDCKITKNMQPWHNFGD